MTCAKTSLYTTTIGHKEPDPVQPSILGGPRSLVINGLRYFPKKGTHTEGNAQAKLLGLEFQILQVLCKSTKSVRIGARILVVESFS